MKTIVIFGATGGVGAYTALYLKDFGYNIIAVGKRKSDNNFFENINIKYYSVNITLENTFSVLPTSEIDAIIHLAGSLPARMEGYNPQEYIDTNITGTLNIINYAVKCKVEKLIFATTLADVSYLWGTLTPIGPDAQRKFPINSDHSVYAITKNTAVDLIQHYAKKLNFKYYIIRFANVFLYHPNSYYFVNGIKRKKGQNVIIEQAIKGEDIELWGNPNRSKDVFYVKDCTQLIEKCISSNSSGGIFNVGTGVVTSRQKQIEGIIEVFSPLNKKSIIIQRPELPDSPQFIFDISKNIIELGYVPKFDYISYLKDLKEEMRINRFEKLWGKPEDYLEE